jgi:hypothetical protein
MALNVGLASFATKSDLLGSPSSARRSSNIWTDFGALTCFGIPVGSNLTNTWISLADFQDMVD